MKILSKEGLITFVDELKKRYATKEVATSSSKGLMSNSDKIKLENSVIPSYALKQDKWESLNILIATNLPFPIKRAFNKSVTSIALNLKPGEKFYYRYKDKNNNIYNGIALFKSYTKDGITNIATNPYILDNSQEDTGEDLCFTITHAYSKKTIISYEEYKTYLEVGDDFILTIYSKQDNDPITLLDIYSNIDISSTGGEQESKIYIADITNITGAELSVALSAGKVVYANTLYGTVPLAGYEIKNIFNEDGSRETVVYFNFKGIQPGNGKVSTTVVEWNRTTNTTKKYLRTDNDNIALVDTTWEYDDVKDLIDKGRNVFLARYTENDDDNDNLYYSILPFSGICAEHSFMYRDTDDTTSTEFQFVGYDAARGCNVKVYCFKKYGSSGPTMWKTEDATNDIIVLGATFLPTFNEIFNTVSSHSNSVVVFKFEGHSYICDSIIKWRNAEGVAYPAFMFVRGNQILYLIAANGMDKQPTIRQETFAGISVDNDGYLVQDADD